MVLSDLELHVNSVCSLLSLAFTDIYPHCCMALWFILFLAVYIVFYCRNMAQFIYFTIDEHFGHFQFRVYKGRNINHMTSALLRSFSTHMQNFLLKI